ncbi:heparan-alpha-glucosaminide N-acetyltransferase [Anabrus simplex]|uniref:heparan-alpha-glucosaminide N-acetyltransferase n=1 Tax=Anabrus simplex TaxID=316456 RepID=UPI0035A3B4EA
MDEAWFHVMSQSTKDICLFRQSEECYMCEFLEWARIEAKGNVSLVVKTVYPVKMYFESNGQRWCHTTYSFKEYGQYRLNISDSGCDSIEVLESPFSALYPILGAFFVLFLFVLLWNLVKFAVNYKGMANTQERVAPSLDLQSDLGSPSLADDSKVMKSERMPAVQHQKTRIVSLDTFRGISIAVMIFVNYGGGGYELFKHCAWNGLNVADLVYPWFMWIMGVSLVISLQSQLKSSLQRKHLFLNVLLRSMKLLAVGVSLYSNNTDLFSLRVMGVLQRIGILYLIVGTIETMLIQPQGSVRIGKWPVVQDVLDSWLQWLIVIILTTVHTTLTFLMPVPNCPKGYLGPGGLHYSLTQGYKYANCTGGAAGYIDRLILGEKHMIIYRELHDVYHTSQPYDDCGLLGTLSSVLTVYLGVQAGRVMLYYHSTFPRVARWTIWATVTGFAAGILCKFSKEEGWIPINKKVWSLSFVLAMASMSFFMQSVLYLVIDDRHWWSGTPFHYAGMNPLLLYVGHQMTKSMLPWNWKPFLYSHTELLTMNLWGTALWLITAYILFCKNIFLTV